MQDCVQIHGGIGVTFEHDLHLYLRRHTVNRALYGTPSEHRQRLGDHSGNAGSSGMTDVEVEDIDSFRQRARAFVRGQLAAPPRPARPPTSFETIEPTTKSWPGSPVNGRCSGCSSTLDSPASASRGSTAARG